MKHTQTRAQRTRQVQSLAILAMFTAIIFLLTFTPLGLIDLPVIKATVLHVPVIIGSILLGPKKGAFLGGMFGLASLLKNTLVPGLSSFVFTPLIPAPGLDRGSPWALFICFVPRILVGVTPWLVYALFRRLPGRRGAGVQAGTMALAGVVGAFTNTALVMGSICVLFTEAYAALQAANIRLGICDRIAEAVEVDDSLTLRYRSVMGVELPIVKLKDSTPGLYYGLDSTNSQLDDVYLRFCEVKRLTVELAEVESSVYRLAGAIQKTQKRANALSNIMIPQFTATIKYITEVLEEKEREDFSRLKVIKKQRDG